MSDRLPLSTLLSQALVAFTIEFDNEAEHLMPHRTNAGLAEGAPQGSPWLASQPMWANVLQYVDDEGTRVKDIHTRSRTTSDSLAGLRRWRYVTIDPWPHEGLGGGAPADSVVRLTSGGRRSAAIWQPLAGTIEERWRSRFGASALDGLNAALDVIIDQIDDPLPCYLPVVYPTQNGKAAPRLVSPGPSGLSRSDGPALDLSARLSQVLLGFALDFEAESRISLTISANTLRVLDTSGVRVRDLPVATGVSREGNAMAVGFLERHGCVDVVPDPSSTRGKVVRLTTKGRAAQAKYHRILGGTEDRWSDRFGTGSVEALFEALEQVAGGDPAGPESPLFGGLEPYPQGWRASVRRPVVLPHYPMVLHRGGYPDGS
jgi:DNA-binding MarR family transcriptional regulator